MATSSEEETCVFCKIVREKTAVFFYENEGFIAFKDKKPAAAHHYLIIPKKHVKNPSTLQPSDLELVKQLFSIGKEVLQRQNASTDDARFGFHWPPFNSIQHLHMHAISPASSMGFVSKLIFKPDTYWFVSAASLVEKLEKKISET
ncbi:adenosine 5'-monophosphoramidase HINT3-like [Uloborus diversus]|uniref:adenosine 5'-monophosphoramidase HINT3-like n=1 Tax=Uloborus diversus TaxID=327109 RepID=UPI00240A1D4C|nr:adenosine 5'-monophosphoramidase HINT3-like [Uloborus diversus]